MQGLQGIRIRDAEAERSDFRASSFSSSHLFLSLVSLASLLKFLGLG
jgi:hypothetical protein